MSEITTAHILVTSLCDRDCKYCCNKQYDLNSIPYITDEELRRMKRIYLTGGEPFKYANPCAIATMLKSKYKNIESVIVYANAKELANYLLFEVSIYGIDGVTVSVKTDEDQLAFERIVVCNRSIAGLPSNRLYLFPGFEDTYRSNHFDTLKRDWQKEFVAAPNSIFRKL